MNNMLKLLSCGALLMAMNHAAYACTDADVNKVCATGCTASQPDKSDITVANSLIKKYDLCAGSLVTLVGASVVRGGYIPVYTYFLADAKGQAESTGQIRSARVPGVPNLCGNPGFVGPSVQSCFDSQVSGARAPAVPNLCGNPGFVGAGVQSCFDGQGAASQLPAVPNLVCNPVIACAAPQSCIFDQSPAAQPPAVPNLCGNPGIVSPGTQSCVNGQGS